MPERAVCGPEARAYSKVDEFLSLLHPLTPRGADWFGSFPVSDSREEIESRLDDTETAIAFLRRASRDVADRVAWHMRRIARLPDVYHGTERHELGIPELFAVKKFIANYRSISALVDGETSAFFGLEFGARELAVSLAGGGSDPETFHIADSQDEELGEVRREIRALDDSLERLRTRVAGELRVRYGIDFGGASFLVVPHGFPGGLLDARESFAVTPYDDAHWKISVQPSVEELALESRREAMAGREAVCEDRVIGRLSEKVRAEAGELARCEAALARFDIARAAAAIALELGLTRPAFLDASSGMEYSLRGGVFLPCERICRALGSEYTPLDIQLSERAAVIFGSNMGGKTVALQSFLFFQILAQLGLFVPAISFGTRPRAFIQFVGDTGTGTASRMEEGLSGFGFEIRGFCEAWEASERGALLAFDEFARTTSSPEAEALISAALEALVKREGALSLFSTHFSGVARIAGVRYLRVPGLNREGASLALASGLPIAERIRRINGLMRHGLVDDPGATTCGSDAVAIASLLGLDADIAKRAAEYYALERNREADRCRDMAWPHTIKEET